MPGTTEKNKIKNNVKVPAAPVLKTYKTKSATDAQMKAAKESISKGDKKAIKKGDLKGGLKRQAKRSAGEAGRDINKRFENDIIIIPVVIRIFVPNFGTKILPAT